MPNRGLMEGNFVDINGNPYGGTLGVRPRGPTPNPQLDADIADLLKPGLVPDIARQSAEIAAGRGVGGSPAGASTAVRMSEQNWLQRLSLANQLMSGQTQRDLNYQITPYQQALMDLQKLIHGSKTSVTRGSPGGGGGGYNGPVGSSGSPWAGFPVIESVYGTRPDSSGVGGGILEGGYMGGGNPLGGGTQDWTLDDAYDWLGFGDFGSLPGDEVIQPPDWSVDMFD